LENHYTHTPTKGSPARLVRYVFSATKYSKILSRERCLRNVFWRRRVRTDQRWYEGVGANGGQLGSSARARRSLAVDSRVSFMSPMGARIEATQDGGGSQPEERHGLAAEVVRIERRRKTRYGGFWKIFPYPIKHLWWRGDSINVSDLPLP
jgi:hypothetical protein